MVYFITTAFFNFMALSIIGTPQAVAATSITLPTHAVGDIIIIWAYRDGSTATPTKPTAIGTVPAWVDINNPTGANTNAARSAYFVATATNHTSGTWANATGMAAIVLRGQAASPIGGNVQSGSTGNGTAQAPAVTLSNTSGSSIILEFYGHRTVTAWSTAPAGYTRQASVATEVCLNTKDSSTSDGAISQTCTTTNSGYRAETIEILVANTTSSVTQTGTSRVTHTSSRTVSGLARITATTLKTQSGLSRVQKSSSITQTGLSKISKTTTLTQLGASRITAHTTILQSGVARIQVTSVKVQSGVSRIKATSSKVQTGVSRITKNTTLTQLGVSRVQKSSVKTQIGITRIQATSVKIVTGVANIRTSTQKYQVGVSRITTTTQKTISGTSLIIVASYANIKDVLFSTFLTESILASDVNQSILTDTINSNKILGSVLQNEGSLDTSYEVDGSISSEILSASSLTSILETNGTLDTFIDE